MKKSVVVLQNPPEEKVKKKRIRDPQRTRAYILEMALTEFAERGYEGARIDTIAGQSQTNKSLIYKYFESKEALYAACLEQTYENMRASQHEIQLDEPDPIESMRKLIESTFDTFVSNPRLVRILTHENVHHARFLKQAKNVKHLYTPLLEKMAYVLQKGQQKGVFRAGVDLKNLYISISSLGYFYFSNIHTLSIVLEEDLLKKQNIRKQRKQAVEMVLAYLMLPEDLSANHS